MESKKEQIMSYKIAVASSDGKNIDLSFGGASYFRIYEVEGEEYTELASRIAPSSVNEKALADSGQTGSHSNSGGCASSGCGNSSGCGTGTGCGGGQENFAKVELIRDCRCVVCKKIGFNIQKELEKRAISSFDIDCEISEALKRIAVYLYKIDNHISLRKSK